MGIRNWNYLCPYCLTSQKGANHKCGRCRQDLIPYGYRPRVPKRYANRSKWKKFFELFPTLLEKCPPTKALIKLGLK